ncbi:MAG TPA: amino acid adenylation domain-containing protein, partial [Blastocatellia bacterium]|nr:amino acid adenylation domain-containing protein [Blastocatellia bacterium]
WSYEELIGKSTLIAGVIRAELGFEGERIAVLFDTGAPMISALLGVLAAGKAYVPLDPRYPLERLQYILRDSGASAILTGATGLDIANALNHDSLTIINIDSLNPGFGGIGLPAVSPNSIAYILYTSGSTGQPKGVFQSQQNVLHHIATYSNSVGIGSQDRLTLLSSYSFDAAVMDIFGALLNGATLCPMDVKAKGIDGMPEWIHEQEITIYHSTPTLYRYFAGTIEAEDRFPAVRAVVLGGEEAIRGDVDVYRKHFLPHCVFVNGLGPTESTLALQQFVWHDDAINRNSVPIGHPVQDADVMLLNDAGRQLAVHGIGEIAIRSPHVALGYWRQPDLSAAVFVPDPDGGDTITYRTGDVGRLLPDGSIEYVGRKDQQVKVRGFRVELAEIESVLSCHPNVRQAVVVVAAGGRFDNSLVSYLVPRCKPWPAANELAAFAGGELPDYMVPAAFYIVEELRLTPSGKVDRRALPSLISDLPCPSPPSLPPSRPVEDIVSGIVAEVLRAKTVGLSDNFFDMGGHSLLAMLVVSRVRKAFGVDLPLRIFFEAPTASALSGWIESAIRADRRLKLPPLRAFGIDSALASTHALEDTSRRYPLSFAQQRLYFLERFQPGTPVYNIPAGAMLRGPLKITALDRALTEVVRRHASLRTTFALKDGEPVQIVRPPGPSPIFLVDLLGLSPDDREIEASSLADHEARRPFDLETGPLLRTWLIRVSPTDHLLLFTMHHIISDGWSIGVFTRDLADFYKADVEGVPAQLSDLPISYIDFAMWQRQWLRGEVLESELAFWRKQLAQAPAILALPLDRPRPPVRTFAGARRLRTLPPYLPEALRRLSRKEEVTLFMTLLAAACTLFSRYAAQDDLIVGTPIANRNQPDIENLIGFFVNMVALRVDLSRNPTFSVLLGVVREVALEAFTHQDLPFEKLVEELQPDRDPSRQPIVQVVFVLQNMPEPDLDISGMSIGSAGVTGETAKFDLTLSVVEYDPGLLASLEYNCDLFDDSTIERMAEHYQILLESVAADS